MNCRLCQCNTSKILDFGNQPLANDFQREIVKDKYPLSIDYCNNCGLLQLTNFVDYNRLFKNYCYFTSASNPMKSHFMNVAENLKKYYLKSNGYLLDIGCNDCTFLKLLSDQYKCVGIDPAQNIINETLKYTNNISLINDFFNQKSCETIMSKHGKASVVTAFNVIAHTPNINETLSSIFEILDDNGILILEVQYAKQIIEKLIYDQIYHEHCYYFTLKSISYLLKKYGFYIHESEIIDPHGGSLHIVAGKKSPLRYNSFIESQNLLDSHLYLSLQERINNKISQINQLIHSDDNLYYGYGAPAKATILCNTIPELKNRLMYCIDSTEAKHYCFIPGSDIPIYMNHQGDINNVFLFAWNYFDYIYKKENNFKHSNLLVPFPDTILYKKE